MDTGGHKVFHKIQKIFSYGMAILFGQCVLPKYVIGNRYGEFACLLNVFLVGFNILMLRMVKFKSGHFLTFY